MKNIILFVFILIISFASLQAEIIEENKGDKDKYILVYECFAYNKNLSYTGIGISESFKEAKEIAVNDCLTGECWVHTCNKTYGIYSKEKKEK